MHKTKQIIVVACVVVLMGVLLVQPIKGLVKQDKGEEAASTQTESTAAEQVTLASVSAAAKNGLNPDLIKQIEELESQVSDASGAEKVELLGTLAKRWDDVAKAGPLGFTYEELAQMEPSYENWVKAGDAFTVAYSDTQDTASAPAFVQHAQAAYQKALALNPEGLDAKTGLGSAIVNGGGAPMQGIALLQEVIKAEPKNLKANMSLGLFSMQSRQFDKAIDRFKTVIEVRPSAEAWFYLATSYENIGLKADAVQAFQKSKELAADPSLSQFIDRKVEELSK